MSSASPRAFIVRTLFWLPLCFAVWYLSANYWLAPIRLICDALFTNLLPGLIATIEAGDHVLECVTRLRAGPGGAGVLSFDVNPLAYAYGLPLYASLTLAAPSSSRSRKLALVLFGLVALTPILIWSVSFDILKTLAFNLGLASAAHADFSGARREIIAWGYQFGTLILPGVAPLALWFASQRAFLRALMPGSSRHHVERAQL